MIMNNATVVRNSADMFSGDAATSSTFVAATDPDHPFGNELAQVHEVAEEFGGVSALLSAEEREMEIKGLIKYDADEYVRDLLSFWNGAYVDDGRLTGLASPWI
jgi:hypothetical protein